MRVELASPTIDTTFLPNLRHSLATISHALASGTHLYHVYSEVTQQRSTTIRLRNAGSDRKSGANRAGRRLGQGR